VHGIQDLLILMRASDGEDIGMVVTDIIGLGPQTARDNDLAVFLKGLANGIKGFSLRGIQKAAGVHDDSLGPGIIRRDRITLGTQAGENAFTINKGLGAAKRDHANGRLAGTGGFSDLRGGGKIRAEAVWVLGHGVRIAVACGVWNGLLFWGKGVG